MIEVNILGRQINYRIKFLCFSSVMIMIKIIRKTMIVIITTITTKLIVIMLTIIITIGI